MRVVIAGFTAGALLFMTIGSILAAKQAHKLETYQPVQAEVLSTKVEIEHNHDGSTMRPIVVYRYEVGGRTYRCDSVTIMNESSNTGWASRAIRQFPVGKMVTAYYNPGDPSSAFLVHEVSFFPYAFTLFPMIHLCLAVGLAVNTRMTRWPRVIRPAASAHGWYRLEPYKVTWQKLQMWLVVAILWYGVGAAALGHYYHYAAPPYPMEARIGTLIYLGLGLIPVIGWGYYVLLMYRSFEATMLVKSNSFALGDAIQVRLVYPIRSDVTLEKLELGLVCDIHIVERSPGSAGYTKNVAFEQWHELTGPRSMQAGQQIDATQELTIPADRWPSRNTEYPRYVWKIVCRAALRNCPDYRADFLIDVAPAGKPVAISAAKSTL
jgi:hypothetical protein